MEPQIELSVSNMDNFARISQAIDTDGYSERIVKYLANNVIKNQRTTGPSVVQALVGCACSMNYKLGGSVVVASRERRKAIHALFGINNTGMKAHISLIYTTFQRETDMEVRLGLGLLLIANKYPLSVKGWMMNNLKNNSVWQSAYFNAISGAIIWDGGSYGYSDVDSVWNEDIARILDYADMYKLKSVLTHPDYKSDSIRQMVKPGNTMLIDVMTAVAKHTSRDNINEACDIMREVNGWSVVQSQEIQDELHDYFESYYPGTMTLDFIDTEILQVLAEVENWKEMYSFRQWLKMLARNIRIIETDVTVLQMEEYRDDLNDPIQQLKSIATKMRELMSDIRSVIENEGEYGIQYRRIFSILE